MKLNCHLNLNPSPTLSLSHTVKTILSLTPSLLITLTPNLTLNSNSNLNLTLTLTLTLILNISSLEFNAKPYVFWMVPSPLVLFRWTYKSPLPFILQIDLYNNILIIFDYM
uniref:Uncharacterized protein n=1 Tax=Schistocephalus solidus TaxID=70667 RepID=A0A0X3PGD7_SCHSO